MVSTTRSLYRSAPEESPHHPLTQGNLQSLDQSATTPSTTESSSSQSTMSSTDPRLSSILRRKGVDSELEDVNQPKNLNKLLGMLNKKRSEQDGPQFEEFHRRIALSFNEEVYKVHFISAIFFPAWRNITEKYTMQMDLSWTKTTPNFDKAKELPDLKPDYFEAFHTDSYPQDAIDALDCHIRPSIHAIAAPTFCVEFKAPYKGSRNARVQAAYDGAVMVDAAWEAHKYMKKPARFFLGHTKAIVVTITDNLVDVYTCHAEAANTNYMRGHPKALSYHTYNVACMKLNSADDFEKACLFIRNAQDWCRAQAEATRDELKKYCG